MANGHPPGFVASALTWERTSATESMYVLRSFSEAGAVVKSGKLYGVQGQIGSTNSLWEVWAGPAQGSSDPAEWVDCVDSFREMGTR